jgi:hypothetical protein
MELTNYIKKNSIIIFLLLTASALRLYHLFDLQYTFDELSALNRLEYNSFSELIKKGVMPDAHPALVQVFLYYYTSLFGTTEWIVKLPFIFTGIGSVYIAYSIGKRWFSETTGLLTATLITCSQYFIFYSVTARPYISGMFLSLLTLKYWLEIVFNDSPKTKHYVYFAIFAALSALNHHFSMMFGGLCGLLGLFFISKSTAKNYLFVCFGAVILYAPHFPILINQLNTGGIGVESGGWLDPPKSDFILNFVFYLFHYSYVFVFIFIGVILYAFVTTEKNNNSQQKKIRLALILLFTLSFLIGFFYSLKVNPVIQFSTLIFATPCLLLFLTSFAGELSLKNKWICISLLLIVGLSTLIFKRKYYKLVYNQPFDTYIRIANDIIKEKGAQNVYGIFKGESWFLNYYKKKYHSTAKFDVVENESRTLSDYKAIYDTLTAKYLILGDFNPSQLLQASLYFPFVYKKIIGYGYEVYILSKEQSRGNLESEKFNPIGTNFINIPKEFNINSDLIISNNGKKYYQIDSLNEYPLSFKIKNTLLNCKEGQSIVAEIKYQSNGTIKGLLCASTDANKKNVHWTQNNIDAFYNPKEKTQTAYASIYVSANFNEPDNELTIFIWNNNKEKFLVSAFSVYVWDNNPYRYGLLSDF